MRRVAAVLAIAILVTLMVVAIAVSYLGGSRGLAQTSRMPTAVSLDLDGETRAETQFAVGSQQRTVMPLVRFRVRNAGTRAGFLDIVDMVSYDFENGCEAGERAAGDLTCGYPGAGEGELHEVMLLRIFLDTTCDLALNAGDQLLYSGELRSPPESLGTALPMLPGAELCFIFAFERPRSDLLTRGALTEGDTIEISVAFALSP